VSNEVIARLRARLDECERELVQQRAGCKNLTKFSVSDEGAKCKVYVEIPDELLETREESEDSCSSAEAAVNVTFTKRTCVLRLSCVRPDGLMGERRAVTLVCETDVVPDKCAFKVDRTKGRVTITFKKADELKKWRNVTTQVT